MKIRKGSFKLKIRRALVVKINRRINKTSMLVEKQHFFRAFLIRRQIFFKGVTLLNLIDIPV
jgi:hypothetical protein